MMMLKPRPLDQWDSYCYYTALIPADTCNQIVTTALARPRETGVVDAGARGKITDTKIRDSRVRWLPPADDTRFLYDLAIETMDQANRARWHFDLVGFTDSLQFTEYLPGCHYVWHIDLGAGLFSTRKLSLVVQLSEPDSYRGGDFEVMGQSPDAERSVSLRQRGTAIVFPAYTMHRITPVESGIRSSLVAWMDGPPFR
jgi:PKHD-type hydroxylase